MRTRELKALCDQHDPWQLFERLLGQELRPHKTIRSPFREERTPSFGVYRGQDGKVRFKDFGGEYGDIYQLVALVHKVDWKKAVEIVAAMLDIRPTAIPIPNISKLRTVRATQVEKPAVCEFIDRGFTPDDDHFWSGYNIDIDLLAAYDVFPCGRFLMHTADGRVHVWHNQPDRPLYVYAINGHLKLYDPASPDKKRRYIGNTRREDVFGMKQLGVDTKPVVICAGQKDALTMMANFQCRAIAFNGESLMPDASTMLTLVKSTTDQVYVLYDADNTGELYSKKLCAAHAWLRRIPFEVFSEVKDVSNAVEHQKVYTLGRLQEWFAPR